MQIEIKIDSACKEPKIIIVAERMSEEVNAIVAKLSAEVPQMLSMHCGFVRTNWKRGWISIVLCEYPIRKSLT